MCVCVSMYVCIYICTSLLGCTIIYPTYLFCSPSSLLQRVQIASATGFLGSIDANTGTESLAWDTDQFPMDLKQNTWMMKIVLEQGGLVGGLNFDCKPRRESTEPVDLFIGHIGAMDAIGRGLRQAAKLIESKIFSKLLEDRYLSYRR